MELNFYEMGDDSTEWSDGATWWCPFVALNTQKILLKKEQEEYIQVIEQGEGRSLGDLSSLSSNIF